MRKLFTLLILLFLWAGSSWGQDVNTYSFLSSSGTYTEITGGTQLASGTIDDNSYNANNIGFTFNFGGTNFTQFSANANGFLALGATVSSSYAAISGGTSNNVVAAFNADLQGNTGATLRYELSGTTPNQVMTIQWKDFRHYGAASESYNFQVKLYETTNIVEIIYGTIVKNTTGRTKQVGLRGASSAVYSNRTTLTDWSATTAGAINSATCTLTTTVYPASGLKFSWTPPLPCTGTPDPGNTITSVATVCPGVTFNLSLQNNPPVTGLTYQWQSSLTGADPWTNLGTSSTQTTSQSVATYYRCQVTCSGNTGTSNPVLVGDPAAPSTQASVIVASNFSLAGGVTIGWTSGNGGRRYVVVNNTNSFTNPVGTGDVVVAGTVYSGSGEQIVYDGTGTSVAITGLSAGATYYVRVYEYQRCVGTPNTNYYSTATATNNPNSFTALMNNDLCVNAITLPCGGSIPGTTLGSTNESQAVCGISGVSVQNTNGVWYKINPGAEAQDITVTTCVPSGGTDTRLAVFTGSCGNFTCIGGNDDNAGCTTATLTSEVLFAAAANTDYYILVYMYSSTGAAFTISASCIPICSPTTTNDVCENAQNVAMVAYGGSPTSTNNSCSTAEGTVAYPTCGSSFGSYFDVWYRFNTGINTTGTIKITLGTATGVGFAVYSGACASLTQVSSTCGIISGNEYPFTLTASTDYYLRVFTTSAASRGTFDIAIQEPIPTPIFLVTPSTMDYGTVNLGGSFSQVFTISNNGGGTMIIDPAISVTGIDASQFVLADANTYPVSLTAGQSTTVSVAFTPTSEGVKNANLIIVDNLSTRTSNSVLLTGTGFVRPAGSTCENPYLITLPLVDYIDNTLAYGNDYLSTWVNPATSYLNGYDFVAKFTLAQTGLLSGSVAGSWTGVIIVQDCPNATTPPALLALGSGATGGAFSNVLLPPGDYFAIVSTYPTPDYTDFTLNLSFVVVETGSLSGKITDCYTSANLAGVTVTAGTLPATTTNATGNYSFADVPVGTYTITASLTGYNTNSASGVVVSAGANTRTDICLNVIVDPPLDLTAALTGQNVHLAWLAPGTVIPGNWIKWDDGINTGNSIGTNAAANFDVASRWPVSDIAAYDGQYLRKVRFVPAEAACTYTIKIWKGANAATLLYSQVVTAPTIGTFNEITLTSPVLIDGTDEFWFGYNANTTTGYPAGCDAGPQVAGKGNMIYWSGAWAELTALNVDLTFNWNLAGFVSTVGTRGPEQEMLMANDPSLAIPENHSVLTVLQSVQPNRGANQGTLMAAKSQLTGTAYVVPSELILAGNPDPQEGVRAPMSTLTGYNVYRNDVKIANNISPLYYDDYNLPVGTYTYKVTAQYLEGESAPAGPVVVSIITCPAPSGGNASNQSTTEADLGWTENGSATEWDIELVASGDTPTGTPTYPGVTQNPYHVINLSPGTYYDFYVKANCGGSAGPSTWSGPYSFSTQCEVVVAPFTETVEVLPSCWTISGGTYNWAISSGASGYGIGANSFFAGFYSINSTTPFDLFTPVFDASALTSPQLEFDFAYATYIDEVDEMDVYYSTDGGATYTLLLAMPGGLTGILNTGGATSDAFVPTSDQWATQTIALPAGTNKIAFEAISAFGNNLYLDNVRVNDAVTTKTLNLTDVRLEHLFVVGSGGMMNQANNATGPQYAAGIADMITVELHDATTYSTIMHSAAVALSTSGTASVTDIPGTLNGSYRITIKHRNSIETTSALPVDFSAGTVSYAFNTDPSSYLNNLKLIDGFYCIYGGDVNQDGQVEQADVTLIENGVNSFASGYLTIDVDGDGSLGINDYTIWENNNNAFVQKKTP